jgi:Transposase DDE domain
MREADCFDELHGKLDGDWRMVERVLPLGWQAKARELGAIQRSTGLSDASVLLRVLLIHLADGAGLRETSVRAKLADLADISDVGILKRLKRCGAWFEWMAQALRQSHAPCFAPALSPALGAIEPSTARPASMMRSRRLRLVDGTMVSEPGYTGSKWRLHYSVTLPNLACDEVLLTTPKFGETLRRYTVVAGDIFIADRGFANPAGVAHVVDGQADLILRTNLVTLPLYNREGKRFDVLTHLRTLQTQQIQQSLADTTANPTAATASEVGDWPVAVKVGKRLIVGRLCAVKKSAASTEKGQRRVKRESQRCGSEVRPETLEAAGYVFVFTTLDATYSAKDVLELYRLRWQIELVFKRLKSLLHLGHLKKHDEQAARAWLQGKLLVACMIEKLLVLAEHISPWGFEIESSAPRTMRVA